ncbi:amidohydrolase family protein [uncultured Megasphaera sp.]|uniref:metal-dependent hydrolase family protein n=1 Tax=uncultured Megasphaera sp. TaxID=165188 RepID=UPI0025D70CA6|nr:amidohydrolase family protein [uncultured Megasphaera sp.]
MSKIAFTGGLLIDGTGAPAVENSVVLIEKDKILYAGENRPIPEGYTSCDIHGKTIMPGLIDAHLHFSGNLTGDDSEWVTENNIQKTVVAVQQAHECLEAGLTTVGEISRFGIDIRNMIDAKVMKGPRVVASGLGFCAMASHGDSHKVSIAQNKDAHPWAECVDSPWDLRKAVRRRLRDNPDAIKIWVTGGGIWRWDTAMDQHYTMEEVQAVVDECQMRHIPVWAHCFGSAYNSVKAGADFIIHGQSLDDETLDMMAEKGIALCPTINFMPEWLAKYPPKYDPAIHDTYPGDTVAEKDLNRIYENLRKANEKGIMLTIGSDSFNSQMTPYGVTAVGELTAFVEKAGIDEMDTIVAATLNGAKALHVSEVTGSLEAGKSADLLVIDGNPLKNIRDMQVENMDVIMKEGDLIRNRLRESSR